MKTTESERLERAETLLRAAYDLLTICENSHYVRQASDVVVFYDEAMCDGYCLRTDIACALDIEETADPLTEAEHEN